MDPHSSWLLTFTLIIVALILVALNAFFVAAEFAIVKVRRTRLEELAGKGIHAARISILCVDRLDDYLSATQLGITLVSLALGWIGEESFYELLVLLFPEYLASGSGAYHIIAAGLAFFMVTVLHVVLGELVPKSMAIQSAEKITLWVSRPLHWFYRAAKPLIHLFTAMANFILHRIGYRGLEEEPLSEEELKLVMRDSSDEGVITESEAQIIQRAFSFSDKRAADIMIPAEKVNYLSLSRSFDENIAVAKSRMHTRFPLTTSGLNTVIGVIHVKDVLHLALHADFQLKDQTESNAIFRQVLRPATFVDTEMRQDQLMKTLKEKRVHLAIVQDSKTQSNVGIVTMEDILEQLVGEILDEHGN